MVRLLVAVVFWILPALTLAQTRNVIPDDLNLTITLEQLDTTPFAREMLLLTIHGVYKRHITLEKLVQPELKGLNWMQLGEDDWYESEVDGLKVKNMRRRVAIFPEAAGRIEIEPFTHHLTLLDEENKWFEHAIHSESVSFDVDPAPVDSHWWFPVRRLQISDDWSNAPDQLAPGEGVLRVVRVSALGVSPDMIPPMPELKSPSALIFPHPEKRLVDLSPQGPVSIAYWRWTIQPRNGVSAILEPIEFDYFDTTLRKQFNVVISAQRIAYSAEETTIVTSAGPPDAASLRSGLIAGSFGISALAALALLFGSDRRLSGGVMAKWRERMRLLWNLRRSSRQGDLKGLRRWGRKIDEIAEANVDRTALLDALDRQIYSQTDQSFDQSSFVARFRRTLG